MGGRLVKQQYSAFRQDRPRNGKSDALTAANADVVGVQTIWKPAKPDAESGGVKRGTDVRVTGGGTGQQHIGPHGAGEDMRFVVYQRESRTCRRQRNIFDIDGIDRIVAVDRVEVAGEHRKGGRFARTVRSGQQDSPTWPQAQVERA